MKKISIYAALIISSLTPFSKATPLYQDGDVFLGIRDTTSNFSYMIDLGSADQFIGQLGKSSVTTVFTGAIDDGDGAPLSRIVSNIKSDLDTFFTSSWYSNSNLKYGIFGGFQLGSVYSSLLNMPDNAIVLSTPAAGMIVGNQPDAAVTGLGGQAGGVAGTIGTSTNTPAQTLAWYSANSGIGSWAGLQYGGTATVYNNQGSSAFGLYPGSLETSIASGSAISAIYNNSSGVTGGSLGTFAISSDGALSYTTVPEPSTYALMLIAGVLLGYVRLRRIKL